MSIHENCRHIVVKKPSGGSNPPLSDPRRFKSARATMGFSHIVQSCQSYVFMMGTSVIPDLIPYTGSRRAVGCVTQFVVLMSKL